MTTTPAPLNFNPWTAITLAVFLVAWVALIVTGHAADVPPWMLVTGGALGQIALAHLPALFDRPPASLTGAGGAAALLVALAFAGRGCAADPPIVTVAQQAEVAAKNAEEQECVFESANREGADACIARVRDRWCAPGQPLAIDGACGDAGVPRIVTVGQPPMTVQHMSDVLAESGAAGTKLLGALDAAAGVLAACTDSACPVPGPTPADAGGAP